MPQQQTDLDAIADKLITVILQANIAPVDQVACIMSVLFSIVLGHFADGTSVIKALSDSMPPQFAAIQAMMTPDRTLN